MDKRIAQLIIVMIVLCFLFAEGSYDILNLPQDARSLALNNTTSAYDDPFMHSNPAAISMRSSGMSYSYLYLPANIHLGKINHINNNNKRVRAVKFSLLNYGTIVDSETEEKSYAVDALVEIAYKKDVDSQFSQEDIDGRKKYLEVKIKSNSKILNLVEIALHIFDELEPEDPSYCFCKNLL